MEGINGSIMNVHSNQSNLRLSFPLFNMQQIVKKSKFKLFQRLQHPVEEVKLQSNVGNRFFTSIKIKMSETVKSEMKKLG